MNKAMRNIVLSALFVLCLSSAPSYGMNYIAEPVLVTQPAYSGMSFYVYRPYNMPAGWFVTYDGYPVTRSSAGNWVYGVQGGAGLYLASGYVVGSVVPMSVPQLVTVVQPQMTVTQPVVVQPQMVVAPQATVLPSVPGWLANDNFTVVSKWGRMVDRMAVLHRPRLPLAWKGDKPEVIYGWTGKSWYQMRCREDESPAETLKRHVYELTRMANQNNFKWNDSDTSVLASQSPVWGYLWMGRIAPINL
nr:hypothetical protein [uncultured Dethiosulfovibrio sp.]